MKIKLIWSLHIQPDMDVVSSCEHDEHLKIDVLMVKLPPDFDQTSVFQNEKWRKTNDIIQEKILDK